jgi:hypothetical protein
MNTKGVDKEGKNLLICTDSLSLHKTMKKGPISQKLDPAVRIWSDLLTLIDDFG